MRSVNKVIILGNITRDPNLRQTPSGQLVATFGIATNRQWMTKGNDKHASTEFHEIVAWAKLADLADRHLRKGKLIYVEGYLSTRSWETPQGTKKFKTEIVAQDIIILNKKDDYSEPIPTEEPAAMEKPAEPAVTETVMPVTPEPQPEPVAHQADDLISKDLGL